MSTLLIGYDVEAAGRPEVTRSFLDTMGALHRELEAPCTMFLVGKVIEENTEQLLPFVEDPLFDIEHHTYSHRLLKTVCIELPDGTTQIVRGGSIDQLQEEMEKVNAVLRQRLGVEPLGMCGPWNYYRGLSDRPDILEVLHRHSIRFTRTYGRNEKDYQPTPFTVQPFWYEPQGFSDILELPIQGWQDCYLRGILGWEKVDEYIERICQDLEHVAESDFVWSYCQHDWSNREDSDMRIIRSLIERARELGVEVISHRHCYERALASRN